MNDTINTIQSKVIEETATGETITTLLMLHDGSNYIVAVQDYESEVITTLRTYADYDQANDYYNVIKSIYIK